MKSQLPAGKIPVYKDDGEEDYINQNMFSDDEQLLSDVASSDIFKEVRQKLPSLMSLPIPLIEPNNDMKVFPAG